MTDHKAANPEQTIQQRKPVSMTDFFKNAGITSLEYFFQENGKPEDGMIFRQKSEQKSPHGCTPASCIVKLFTATIVARLVQEKRLDLSRTLPQALMDHCGVSGDLPHELSSITIAHLLSHTHGLGSILLQTAPCRSDGFISLDQLLQHVEQEGSLFPPGRFHSYGNIGYHFLGLLIEAILGKTFHDALLDEIFRPLQLKYQVPAEDLYYVEHQQTCPASGVGLYVSGKLLLLFARALILENGEPFGLCEDSVNLFMTPVVKAAGWSPSLRGCGYGWKDYGNGWRGHNGSTSNSSVLVRTNKAENHIVALVANYAAESRGVTPLISMLMKGKFPALYEIKPPAVKSTQSGEDADQDEPPGAFGNFFFKHVIRKNGDGLQLEICKPAQAADFGVLHSCSLIKGENDIFFLSKPWKATLSVQIVHDDVSSTRYLWDHEAVWPELQG